MITETLYGKVDGLEFEDYYAFLGMPYAKPPVGELRWRETVRPDPWEGVREAKAYGNCCCQVAGRPGAPFKSKGSEDCLYINVFTPTLDKNAKCPVVFFTHGGAYSMNSGNLDDSDPHGITSRGVILVSYNYRLGVMGFFAHPQLSAESEHHVSGNYAHFDQIMALNWVRENIVNFGGDPDNITVFGCSAGSGSSQLLACSPLSKDLISKAWVESNRYSYLLAGRREEGRTEDLAAAEARGVEFFEQMGVKTIEELRAKSYDELMSVKGSILGGRFAYGTTVGTCQDGYLLPEYTPNANDRFHNANISYVCGNTHDEGCQRVFDLTRESYEKNLRSIFREDAEDFIKLADMKTDEDAVTVMHDTHIEFAAGEALCAANNAANRSVHYIYDFKRINPQSGNAPHGWGHRYIRGAYKNAEGITEVDHKIAGIMLDMFTNFCKTGDPNGPTVPEWRPYTDNDRAYMVFDDEVCLKETEFSPLNTFAFKVARKRVDELTK